MLHRKSVFRIKIYKIHSSSICMIRVQYLNQKKMDAIETLDVIERPLKKY